MTLLELVRAPRPDDESTDRAQLVVSQLVTQPCPRGTARSGRTKVFDAGFGTGAVSVAPAAVAGRGSAVPVRAGAGTRSGAAAGPRGVTGARAVVAVSAGTVRAFVVRVVVVFIGWGQCGGGL